MEGFEPLPMSNAFTTFSAKHAQVSHVCVWHTHGDSDITLNTEVDTQKNKKNYIPYYTHIIQQDGFEPTTRLK